MGYMTSYSLTVLDAHNSVLEAISDEVDRMDVFEEGNAQDGWFSWTTWYDWEEDMVLLSRRFPDVLFRLHGDGDDSEDLWDAYFLGGRMQMCPGKIVYDDFDPEKLVEKDIIRTRYSYQQ